MVNPIKVQNRYTTQSITSNAQLPENGRDSFTLSLYNQKQQTSGETFDNRISQNFEPHRTGATSLFRESRHTLDSNDDSLNKGSKPILSGHIGPSSDSEDGF